MKKIFEASPKRLYFGAGRVGTAFAPVSRRAAAMPAGEERRGDMMKKGDVLLVDKDRDEAEQYCHVLSNAGHIVTCALSGKEAIRRLKDHPVDVVVSDIGLPDIDGIMLTRSIRDISEDVYVVLMGDWPTVEFTKSAMSIGAYDVLSKPVKPDKLRSLVSSVLAARDFKIKEEVPVVEPGEPRVRTQDAVFDSQGLWTAEAPDGCIHVGISVGGWTAGGRMIYLTLPDKGTAVSKGDVLFEIVSSEGRIGRVHKIASPVSGIVVEVKEDFGAELVRAVCDPCADQRWLTPVLTIKP
jgi:CheY-like chemotaxis protein/glycine cleavage system H lipoate-binding protein